MLTLESESPPRFSSVFIEENRKIKYTNSKKGGPYSKEQRGKRQAEVYRLHFDYGYTARHISDMIKVNRNTVNRDLDYWYTKLLQKNAYIENPESIVIINMEKLEIQKGRLRRRLDKAKSIQEEMFYERMIYEINCKISSTYIRLSESKRRLSEHGTKKLNEYLEENHSTTRYLTLDEKISVLPKTLDKIDKLMEQDKTTPPHHI